MEYYLKSTRDAADRTAEIEALLQEYGASAWDVCPECGYQITDGKWMLSNGTVARYYHDACAQKALREVEDQNEQRKQQDNGSYLKGTIGALLGSQ